MKSIEECLDTILIRLVQDWDNYGDERLDLNCEQLLTNVDLPPAYRKHEFFIRLIDTLVKDGFAEIIKSRDFNSKISEYQKNTIITINGYVFILQEGGYNKQRLDKERLKSLEIHQARMSNRIFWTNVAIALGTTAAAVYYLTELYWQHGWFRNPIYYWVIVVTVLTSVLTFYVLSRIRKRK